MNNILTQQEAVALLADISGQVFDAADLDYLEQDIGDPDSTLPITRTAETVEDFKASGFEDYDSYTLNRPGLTILKKGGTYANIVDCGDFRLVTIER